GARRGHGLGVYAGLARGRGKPARHRESHRQPLAEGHASRLRLPGECATAAARDTQATTAAARLAASRRSSPPGTEVDAPFASAMSGPAYPAAHAIAAKVRDHFARHVADAQQRGQTGLAAPPDAETIEALIDA